MNFKCLTHGESCLGIAADLEISLLKKRAEVLSEVLLKLVDNAQSNGHNGIVYEVHVSKIDKAVLALNQWEKEK